MRRRLAPQAGIVTTHTAYTCSRLVHMYSTCDQQHVLVHDSDGHTTIGFPAYNLSMIALVKSVVDAFPPRSPVLKSCKM